MKPRHYDLVDTELGDHVVFTVQECTEEIHWIFDEDNECKKIVSDRNSLQEPKSVDIYSTALGSFITRPITIEANDNLFNIPSELLDAENTGGVWRQPEGNENTDTSRLFKDDTPNTSKLYENSPSTSSNVSFNKNTTAVPFKFSCCKKRTRVVVCVNCGGAYHRECFMNAGGILHERDGRITCCRETTNHRAENELRKKIIQEMDEKSEVMRENRELLKARVVSLEKSNFPQNELVKSLVTAMEDKCKILTENKTLLHEKIAQLESRREPVQNAVRLFEKLISSDIFQQCASLLESDEPRSRGFNINDQGNGGLINLQTSETEFINTVSNSNLPIIENNSNSVESEVTNRLHIQLQLVNNKPNSASKSELQKLITSDKCNDLIRNNLLKKKSLGSKRRKFKRKDLQRHDRMRLIFRKKKIISPPKLKKGSSKLISSTNSLPICDKPSTATINQESSTPVDNLESSSAASVDQVFQKSSQQNITRSQGQKKSLPQDPPKSVQKVSNPTENPLKDKKVPNKSKDKIYPEPVKDNNKKKDTNKHLRQMKTTKKDEEIASIKGKSSHHKSSQDSLSSTQTADSVQILTEKEQTLTNKPHKTTSVGKSQSVKNIPHKSEDIAHKKCKKLDKRNQEIDESNSEETKKVITENQKNCKTSPVDNSAGISNSNEMVLTENHNATSQQKHILKEDQNKKRESIKKSKKLNQIVQDKPDTLPSQCKQGTEVELSTKQSNIIEAQQKRDSTSNSRKDNAGLHSSKNHKYRDQNPVRKENINNNGDRLNEVISKIQNKYKTPLKTQIINNTPTKALIVNKAPTKELLRDKIAIIKKTPTKNRSSLKTGIVEKTRIKSPRNKRIASTVKKGSSTKKRKSATPSKEDRELMKRQKVKDSLAPDIEMIKKYFEEEKDKANEAAADSINSCIEDKTLDDAVKVLNDINTNTKLCKEACKENLSLKENEEVSRNGEKPVECSQWKHSDVKIQIHEDENQQRGISCEGLDDGEDIHVDNVNDDDDDDAASDFPDDNLEESIYVNEEIGEEENDGDARVKEEDGLMDENAMTEGPLDQDTEELPSSITESASFFSSKMCKQEEMAEGSLQKFENPSIDDFECISSLHHEIKLESDDRNVTEKREITSCLVDGDDNKTLVPLLVECNNSVVDDGGNDSVVKGETGIILGETSVEQTDLETEEAQEVQNNISFYSPISDPEFPSPVKKDLNKNTTSTPIAIEKNKDNQTMFSPISNDDDGNKTGERTLFSPIINDESSNQSIGVKGKKSLPLKDSSAVRSLNFELPNNRNLMQTSSQSVQVNLLQVVNLPTSNVCQKVEQENKSKLTHITKIDEEDQEIITESLPPHEDDQLTLTDQCTHATSISEAEEPIDVDNEQSDLEHAQDEMPESVVSINTISLFTPSDQEQQKSSKMDMSSPPPISDLEKTSMPSTSDKKKSSKVSPPIENQDISTPFKKPSLCRRKSIPKTSRSSVVVRPYYCWTYRAPTNNESLNPLVEEALPNQESGEQNDSGPSSRRYVIQVRRDLTNEDLNRITQSNQEGFEDLSRTTHEGYIQVRRDLVQRNEDLGEPSGLIHVRRDLIQTNEDLSRTPGQIQVRRDLGQPQPPSETSGQITVRNDLMQSGEHLCELSGHITVRKDLVQRTGEPPGQLKIRNDLLPNVRESPAKIKVRQDLVLRAEDMPGTSRNLNQEDGGSQSGRTWGIKVKDIQQLIEGMQTITRPVEDVPETAVPLNLCLQEVGVFPSTSQENQSDEANSIHTEQVLNEESNVSSKKYIKVRKDLGVSIEDLEGSDSEIQQESSSLDPAINQSPSKRWSIKVRKDLGQSFDNTDEIENAGEDTEAVLIVEDENISPVVERNFDSECLPKLETLENEENAPCLLDDPNIITQPATDFPLDRNCRESNANQDDRKPKKRWNIKVRTDLVQSGEDSNQSSEGGDNSIQILQDLILATKPPVTETESSKDLEESANIETTVTEAPPVEELQIVQEESLSVKDAQSVQNTSVELSPAMGDQGSIPMVETLGENNDEEIACVSETNEKETENNEEILRESEENVEITKSQEDETQSQENEEEILMETEPKVIDKSQNFEAIFENVDRSQKEEAILKVNMNSQQNEGEVINKPQNEESDDQQNEEEILRGSEVNDKDDGILGIDEEANILNDDIDEDKVLNEFQNDEDEILEELEVDEEETLLNKMHIEQEPVADARSDLKQGDDIREVAKSVETETEKRPLSDNQEIDDSGTKLCNDEVLRDGASEILLSPSEVEGDEQTGREGNDISIFNASSVSKDADDVRTSPNSSPVCDPDNLGIVEGASDVALIPSYGTDVRLIPSEKSECGDQAEISKEEITSDVLEEENFETYIDGNEENDNALEEGNIVEELKTNNSPAPVEDCSDKNSPEIKNYPEINTGETVLLDEEFPKPSTVPVADYIQEYRNLCASKGIPKQTGIVEYSNLLESESNVPEDVVNDDAKNSSDEIEEGEIASSGDEVALVIDESAATSRKRKNRRSKRSKGRDNSAIVKNSLDEAQFVNPKRRPNNSDKEDYDTHYADIIRSARGRKIRNYLKKQERKNRKRAKKMAKEVKKKFEMLYDPVDITLGEQVEFQTESFTEHIDCSHDPERVFKRITWDKNLLRSRTRMVEIYIDVLEKNITRPITLEGNDNIIDIPAANNTSSSTEVRWNKERAKYKELIDEQDDSETKKEHLSVKNINVNVNCDKYINQPSGSKSELAPKRHSEFDLMDYCFTLRGGKRRANRAADDEDSKSPKKLLKKIDVDKFLDMIHKRDSSL